MRAFAVLIFFVAQAGIANAETYYTDIGDSRINLEVPDGYCALTGETENESALMDAMAAATEDGSTFEIAFTDCVGLGEWNQGQQPSVDEIGYIASANVARFAGFTGTQDDFNRSMYEKFSQMPESELGRMMGDTTGRSQAISRSYLGYDSSATYFGVMQKMSFGQDLEKPFAGVYSMITIQGKFLVLFFWGGYSGDAGQIDELLESVKWFSGLQHQVN